MSHTKRVHVRVVCVYLHGLFQEVEYIISTQLVRSNNSTFSVIFAPEWITWVSLIEPFYLICPVSPVSSSDNCC